MRREAAVASPVMHEPLTPKTADDKPYGVTTDQVSVCPPVVAADGRVSCTGRSNSIGAASLREPSAANPRETAMPSASPLPPLADENQT